MAQGHDPYGKLMEDKYSKKIEELIQVVMKVASGDFSVQADVSDDYDNLDALSIGLNMMIDDLREKHLVQKENEYIQNLNKELTYAKMKAEESDKLKSSFLANMSHEIRTPMNGILGFANLLKRRNLSEEKRQEFIGIIEQSGERLLDLINDIISISKIEAGQQKLHLSTFNINDQLQFVYNTFRLEAESRNLTFNYRTGLPDNKVMINTDKEKFFGILSNLVKNAIKYTEEGEIEFGYIPKEGLLEFYVNDTGIGVPEEKQEEIFERFIRMDKADKMAKQGAGLGLSIVKAYTDMLGGTVWMKSREAGGSSFYFTLPYSRDKSLTLKDHPDNNKKSKHKNMPKLNILVAEDDDVSYQLLTYEIEPIIKNIYRAVSGFDVLDIYRKHPEIDLILMDIQLPGLDGYDTTRQIRTFDQHIVIIAQTALGISGDKEKVIEAGCNDYLTKPLKKNDLCKMIGKYFKK